MTIINGIKLAIKCAPIQVDFVPMRIMPDDDIFPLFFIGENIAKRESTQCAGGYIFDKLSSYHFKEK